MEMNGVTVIVLVENTVTLLRGGNTLYEVLRGTAGLPERSGWMEMNGGRWMRTRLR